MRYVYVIKNLINGKVYVGQTKNPRVRRAGHFYEARKGNLRPLYASIRKHGEENFSFEVLEECADELINEREQYWVTHFDSFNSEKGYNLTQGGSGEQKISIDVRKQRQKMCRNLVQQQMKNSVYRTKHVEAFRKASKKRWVERPWKTGNWTGRRHSEKTKQKIGSAITLQQNGRNNSQFGTAWISHLEHRLSKKVLKHELDKFLSEGWFLGRKMKW